MQVAPEPGSVDRTPKPLKRPESQLSPKDGQKKQLRPGDEPTREQNIRAAKMLHDEEKRRLSETRQKLIDETPLPDITFDSEPVRIADHMRPETQEANIPQPPNDPPEIEHDHANEQESLTTTSPTKPDKSEEVDEPSPSLEARPEALQVEAQALPTNETVPNEEARELRSIAFFSQLDLLGDRLALADTPAEQTRIAAEMRSLQGGMQARLAGEPAEETTARDAAEVVAESREAENPSRDRGTPEPTWFSELNANERRMSEIENIINSGNSDGADELILEYMRLSDRNHDLENDLSVLTADQSSEATPMTTQDVDTEMDQSSTPITSGEVPQTRNRASSARIIQRIDKNKLIEAAQNRLKPTDAIHEQRLRDFGEDIRRLDSFSQSQRSNGSQEPQDISIPHILSDSEKNRRFFDFLAQKGEGSTPQFPEPLNETGPVNTTNAWIARLRGKTDSGRPRDQARDRILKEYHDETDPRKKAQLLRTLRVRNEPKLSDEDYAKRLEAFGYDLGRLDALSKSQGAQGSTRPPDTTIPYVPDEVEKNNRYFNRIAQHAEKSFPESSPASPRTESEWIARLRGIATPQGKPWDPARDLLMEQINRETDPRKKAQLLRTLRVRNDRKPTDREYAERLRGFGNDLSRLDAFKKSQEARGDGSQQPPKPKAPWEKRTLSDIYQGDNSAPETVLSKRDEPNQAVEAWKNRLKGDTNKGRPIDPVRERLLRAYHDELDPRRRNEILLELRGRHTPAETESAFTNRQDINPAHSMRSQEIQDLYVRLESATSQNEKNQILSRIRATSQNESPQSAEPSGSSYEQNREILNMALKPEFEKILSLPARDRNIPQLVALAKDMQQRIDATTRESDVAYRKEMQEIISRLTLAYREIPIRSPEDRDRIHTLNNEIQLLTRGVYGPRVHPETARTLRRFSRLRNGINRLGATAQRTII